MPTSRSTTPASVGTLLEAHPLSLAEPVRHPRRGCRGVIERERQEKRLIVGAQMRALHGELPFQPEVALTAGLGVAPDRRHEQGAHADLPADRGIPRILAAQLVLVEPDPDARAAQALAQAPGSRCVL